MFRLFSAIEFEPQGSTRIAYGDGVGYSIFTDYDSGSDTYELKLLVENASYPGSIEELGKSLHADYYPELAFLVESFICALEDLSSTDFATSEEVEHAWEATASLKQEQY